MIYILKHWKISYNNIFLRIWPLYNISGVLHESCNTRHTVKYLKMICLVINQLVCLSVSMIIVFTFTGKGREDKGENCTVERQTCPPTFSSDTLKTVLVVKLLTDLKCIPMWIVASERTPTVCILLPLI